MDKAEALKYIEEKGDSTFVVRTEEEETTFLTNHAKKIEDEIIPGKIGELHKRYDDDVFTVTGIKKEPTEKTYDFIKRVLGDFKTKAEKTSIFEAEIDSLKQKIKDGTGDKQTLADLEATKAAFKEFEDTKIKEITDLKASHEKYQNKSDILTASAGLQFKKNIPESAIKSFVDQVIDNLSNMASRQDGKLVFMENGVPKRNIHNKLEPYTALELLKERLSDILDTGRKENGPALDKEIVKERDDKGKLTKVSMIIPDTVKYKDELSIYLIAAGLLRGTEEYILAYKEYSPGLQMR